MRVDEGDWIEVFKRDKGNCRYCNEDLLRSFSVFQSATVDHLIAVSVGGSDEPDNLVLSCPACNQMLSRAGDLTTFEARKDYLDARREEKSKYWYNPLVKELR